MTRERTTGTRKTTETATEPGRGIAGLTVAWKVAVFLPLVLTGAVLAGRIDLGEDPATSPSAVNEVVVDSRTPTFEELDEKDRGDRKRDRDQKADRGGQSDAPTSEATSAPPTLSPSDTPTADPTQPDPTRSPTKSPTKSPQPSPTATPSPDEAEDMCRRAGVNPLDLVAMANCIADVLGGG